MPGQREMKEKNPWHRPVTIIFTVIGVIAIVALVTVIVLQNREISQKYKYGIVLDAGSSHTSLYIYEWPAEKDNDTGRVEQKFPCQVAGKGISSYAAEPKKAGESLIECLEEAKKKIPRKMYSETPLYLGATAGMRLLKLENSSASDEVFKAVGKTLQSFPFNYQGARILSGQEEGAFGWVTVNYLDDRLKQGLQTTGALDLGGASTQISFVPDNYDGSESPENTVTFRLYGNDYILYTHSFLCYGKDQALRLVLAQQTQQSNSGELLDPCFHKGYNETKAYSAIYDTPCVSGKKPQGAPETFTHSGEGNFKQCQAVIRKVFNFTSCKYSQCSFNGIFQPQLQGQFGAFSAYFFVMNFLNLTDTSKPLETVVEKVSNYCATPWTQIVQEHFPAVKLKYLAEYCFSGTFILTLLMDGYNFTSDTYSNIKYIKKIKNSDAGWTLGYMLNLTNMIPAEAPDKPPLSYAGYISVVIFMAIVLFIIVIFLGTHDICPKCSKQSMIV